MYPTAFTYVFCYSVRNLFVLKYYRALQWDFKLLTASIFSLINFSTNYSAKHIIATFTSWSRDCISEGGWTLLCFIIRKYIPPPGQHLKSGSCCLKAGWSIKRNIHMNTFIPTIKENSKNSFHLGYEWWSIKYRLEEWSSSTIIQRYWAQLLRTVGNMKEI